MEINETKNKNILTENIKPIEEMDVEKVVDIILRKTWVIITICLVALVGSIFYYYKNPDIYQASTKLIIVDVSAESVVSKPEVENIKEEKRGRGWWGRDLSQLLILTGSEMLMEFAKQSDLKDRLHVDSDKRAADIAKGMVSAEYIKDSNVIVISAKGRDPVLCRDVANGLADTFAKDYIKQRLYLSKELLKWFPDEAEKISSETVYGQIKALSNKEVIESLPSVVNNPTIKSLKERRAQIKQELIRLSEFYKNKYPKIASLKSELNYIENQISQETDAVIMGIKKQLSGFLQINTVRVIEYADIPKGPIGPQRNRGIFLNTFLSFLLSISGIIIFESLNTRIRSEFDLKQCAELPFLGYISKIEGAPTLKDFLTIQRRSRNESLKDAFAYIRTTVSFAAPKEKSKIFIVSSSVPSEGKSFISIQLSLAFSRNNEKTLIIDGDLRRSSIHEIMNINKEPGLTEYLAKGISIDDIVHKSDRFENVYFVTSGHSTPNPSELLGSKRLKDFMETVSKKFDRIIIDSAPFLDIPDSFLLSNVVDGLLLVIRSNKIDRRILMRTLEKIRQSETIVSGVIINAFEHHKHGPYYYRYYRKKYYKPYYTSKQSSQIKV